MSSLRDLLDYASTDVIPVPTYYGSGLGHQIWWRGDNCWQYESNHDYAHQEMTWCVPSYCVCRIVFEVWGGGGGGGGAALLHLPATDPPGHMLQCAPCQPPAH